MRTVRRLRLRCLLLASTPDVLSTLLLLTQSILCQAHHKTHYLVLTFGVGLSPATVVMCFMVDLAGTAPAS